MPFVCVGGRGQWAAPLLLLVAESQLLPVLGTELQVTGQAARSTRPQTTPSSNTVRGGGGGRRGEAEKGEGNICAFLLALVKGKQTSCGLGLPVSWRLSRLRLVPCFPNSYYVQGHMCASSHMCM